MDRFDFMFGKSLNCDVPERDNPKQKKPLFSLKIGLPIYFFLIDLDACRLRNVCGKVGYSV
jgi:hypothetical protein